MAGPPLHRARRRKSCEIVRRARCCPAGFRTSVRGSATRRVTIAVARVHVDAAAADGHARGVTRARLQRLGWIAAAVLIAILAWQQLGGRDAARSSQASHPAERRDARRPSEATPPADRARPAAVPRTSEAPPSVDGARVPETARSVDGAGVPDDPRSNVPHAPAARSREGASRGGPLHLPAEAQLTLDAIKAGGPFPHRQDGGVFQNRERLLPSQPRGYYREYTVRTPGSRDRGARRIVTGGDPPREYFYTSDHYRSFQRLEVQP